MSKEANKTSDPIVIPEGDPNKDWTKPELVAYGKREFPNLNLMVAWKEETLLTKLAEAKAAATSNTGDDVGSSDSGDKTPDASTAPEVKAGDQTPKDTKTPMLKPEVKSKGAKSGSSSKDLKNQADSALNEVYKAYFDANEKEDVLHFTQEMDGRTMGYKQIYDAKKRQRQVNPKGQVQSITRKSIK